MKIWMWKIRWYSIKNCDKLADDTVIDNQKVTKKINETITTGISSFQEDDEVLDKDNVLANVIIEMTTNKTVGNKILDHQVEME